MIIEAVLGALIWLITAMLSVFPSLPATPTAITGATGWILGQIQNYMPVMHMIWGQAFFVSAMTLVLAIYVFEYLYHPVMWAIKKIPFIGVS